MSGQATSHAPSPLVERSRRAPHRPGLFQTLKGAVYGVKSLASSDVLTLRSLTKVPAHARLVKKFGLSTAHQIESAALYEPSRVALIDDDGQRTYGEMRSDLRGLAKVLAKRGLGDGSRIGIMCRNSRSLLYPLAVKGYLGADVYLLNVFSSPVQLREMIREHKLDLLVIDSEFAHYVEELRESGDNRCEYILGWTDPEHRAQGTYSQWETLANLVEAGRDLHSAAMPEPSGHGHLIVMSSGTSGTPKGVIHTEASDLTSVASVFDSIPWKEGQTIQLTASMFHFWGWGNVNLALLCRCTIVVRRVFNAKQNVDDMHNYGVNGIISAAVFLKQVIAEIDRRRADGVPVHHESVAFVVSSGNLIHSTLVSRLLEEFGPRLYNFYGSTEVGLVSCATPEMLANDPKTAGKPFSGVDLALLDESHRPVPKGQLGAVHAVSSLSLIGYANDRDVIETVEELIRIGDLGYFDKDGLLRIVGRGDDMIINGGENVYPKSVEDTLSSMPGVADLYVNGVEDEATFARIRAYVVRDNSEHGRALTKEKVQQWVRQKLAEHSVPRDVIWMDAMPRNDMGKVVPRMLPETEAEGLPHE